MEYVYRIKKASSFTANKVNAILPEQFSVQVDDNVYSLIVHVQDEITDQQVFYQVQRECDRIFFLTGENLDPELHCKKKPDGSMVNLERVNFDAYLVTAIPLDVVPQSWKEPLTVQLRLWQLAHLPNIPVATQINLLFQIIEAAYPSKRSYPKYVDTSKAPHPRTEAKLLRNLVSHQNHMCGKQLKKYCQYLGYPEIFYDPSDTAFQKVIESKVPIVKDEARKILEASVSKK